MYKARIIWYGWRPGLAKGKELVWSSSTHNHMSNLDHGCWISPQVQRAMVHKAVVKEKYLKEMGETELHGSWKGTLRMEGRRI